VWEKPLRSLAAVSELKADKLIAVYTGARPYRFDSIDVLPVAAFFDALHGGEIF
jgi:hypothetical protein